MNKLLSTLMCVGLLSMPSCAKQQTVAVAPAPTVVVAPPAPPAPEVAPSASLTISSPNWEFTLPSAGWEAQTPEGAPSAVLHNEGLKNLIIVQSAETQLTGPAIALQITRGFKQSGAQVLSTSTVKNNGITFTCGGFKSAGDQSATCAGIFKTLKIN
jgi:hypothetical protein